MARWTPQISTPPPGNNMVPFTLLSLVIIAVCAHANPLINVRNSDVTIPIAARLNLTGKRLPDIDRARAAQHVANSKTRSSGGISKRQTSFPVTNAATTYIANVGVGTPPSNFTLLIDTGSSNTWVGATKKFTPTSSTQETLDPIEVTYGSGFFSGHFGAFPYSHMPFCIRIADFQNAYLLPRYASCSTQLPIPSR